MPAKKTDILVNVVARCEGVVLHKTLRSLVASAEYAKTRGVYVIINIYLPEDSDSEELRVAKDFCRRYEYIERTTLGAKLAKYSYTTTINSGDLISENFLYQAYDMAKSYSRPAVFTAQYEIIFGEEESIRRQNNSREMDPRTLIDSSLFESPLFISAQTHESTALGLPVDESSRWQWQCELISRGLEVVPVAGTIFFKRQNRLAPSRRLLPSKLFGPEVYSKLPSKRSSQNIGASRAIMESSKTSIKRAMKKRVIAALKRLTNEGNSSTYHFMRDQYFLNRRYLAYMMSRLNRGGGKGYARIDTAEVAVAADSLLGIGVDEVVLEQWASANQYEPMINPGKLTISRVLVKKEEGMSALGDVYYSFCQRYGKVQYTDIVLLNNLVKGGAALASINLVTALSRDLGRKLLVFTTDNIDSVWAENVASLPNVTFQELKDYDQIDEEQKFNFILRIIQNWGAAKLTVINSPFGYELLRRHGEEIKESCRVILHAYAYDMTEDGFLFNIIKNGYTNVYPYVDTFVTDSVSFKDKLIEINGFRSEKIRAIYLPIAEQVNIRSKQGNTKKVLWASRISHAKLIEVAVGIASIIEKEGIELHFHGVIDAEYLRDNLFKNLVAEHKNIYYHGGYDSFSNIDYENYDIFLLTSKNEGMPNVILEAAMANLFLVAANVGGLPEVIEDGENGFLVNDNFAPQEYASKIRAYYQNKDLWDLEKRKKINKQIITRHSWAHYKNDISDLYK